MYSSSATSTVTPLFWNTTLWVLAILSPTREAPTPHSREIGALSFLALQLFRLEILGRGAADGALLGGLDALEFLAADGADHRDGHRRVRGLAVVGLYLLTRVAGEVGDGDLARYDVLHRGTCPAEGVLDEREVYARRAPLSRELLGHVARDVPHKALGRPPQAIYGLLGPGELFGTAFGDEVAGLLEGGVVYRALGPRRLLDLLFGVGDGAASGVRFFHLKGLAAGLLAVLLLDVLARDRGVAFLEGALLDACPHAPLLLPLFEGVEERLGVVGPVQLAAVVDLREVQVALGDVGLRDLRVHRVEVGGAGAADGTLGGLALGYVAAHVALEAVEALGGATDLLLHLGGAHLVPDCAHGFHRAGREDALYDLVYDAGGYDRVALLDGVPDDRAGRHADDEAGNAIEPLEGFLGPRHVLLGGVEVGRLVLEVGY